MELNLQVFTIPKFIVHIVRKNPYLSYLYNFRFISQPLKKTLGMGINLQVFMIRKFIIDRVKFPY